jgi:sugar-specific transcriptional regulator TrmB
MILERLHNYGLVIYDDTRPVREYRVADPNSIYTIWSTQQNQLKELKILMNKTLPDLQSRYKLSQIKPGVVYLEGLNGVKELLNDMAKSTDDILLIPSYTVTAHKEAFELLQKGLMKRKYRGVKTLAVFHEDAREAIDVKEFAKKNVEVRFWGEHEYSGEMAVYGDKVVFTAYEPEIINTIITNVTIAKTMRALFFEVWDRAS